MDPVAINIFGISIYWYGILIAIGVLLAVNVAFSLIKRTENLNQDMLLDYGILAVFIGIIGARLYYVIFEWEYYSAHPQEILAIRNGGLAIHGGIIAGIIVGILFCKYRKINFFELADCIVPGLALAQGIGRWGNYINGEAHGGPTDLPWAIEVNGQMVHPTFLYESILDIGIFIFLYFYMSRHKQFHGQLFFLYIIIYSLGRFFIEGLRTDSLYIGPIRVAQLISLLGIIIGIIYYFYLKEKSQSLGD